MEGRKLFRTLSGNFIQLLEEKRCPIYVLLCHCLQNLKRAGCIQQHLWADGASQPQSFERIQHLDQKQYEV